MDTLIIKGLKVSTTIGVYPWEQCILQELLIDITIPYDFSACQDNIANTIDYDFLCKSVTHFVENRSFQLIETVAESLVNVIKNEFNIDKLTLAVTKPHAIKNAAVVQVMVER